MGEGRSKGTLLGRVVGFGCGAALLSLVAVVLLAKPLLLTLLDAVVLDRMRNHFSLSVETVNQVQLGETFSVTLLFHNEEDEAFSRMLYLDLDLGLYKGFEPASSEPAWLYNFNDDTQHRHKLAYELNLGLGDTPYELQLRATKAGLWEGSIHYYRTTSRRPAGPPIPLSIHVIPAASP